MRSIDMKLVIIIMLITVVGLFAQVPRTLSYQGKLTNPGGNVITTPVNITFRIFNVVSGGTALWTETHSSVPVTNGFFDVTLGESTPITLDFDTQYWIEVQVGSETLTPREKMTSMPYAHRATYTDTAGYVIDGVDITGIDQGHHIYKGAGTSDIEQSVIYEEGGRVAFGLDTLPVGSVNFSFVSEYNANLTPLQMITYYGPGSTRTSGHILGRVARGTLASESGLLANDNIIGLAGRGHDGTGWIAAPKISMLARAEEDWESGKHGTTWMFTTTESGTDVTSEKLRITGSGNVGIGTTSPGAKLEVAGQVKITGGTPGTGKVLTSDADGLATWETPSGGGIPSGAYVAFPDSSARTGWTYTGYYGSSGSGDSWLIRASMPTARRNIAAAAVGGKVYVLGGSGPLSLNEEYDPATNSWTTKTSMPTARYDLVAVAINNKIYAIGGYPATTTNEEYDPATDTWTTKASGSFAMRASAGAAANGRIYVMGGDIAPVSFYNQEYNPATNSWALKTILPTARTRLASATVDNKVYLIGGALDIVGSATNLTLNQQYDPVTDSWTTKASMPTARRYLTATTVNNKIYAIGGYDQNGVGYISSNEEYNPATNTWATKSSMPLARQHHAAAETGGKIYAMGGTASSGVTAINYQYTPPGLDFYWFQKD